MTAPSLRSIGTAFDDRMATVEFRRSPQPHIEVDGSACESCTLQPCVQACPARLFVPAADGTIVFNYEQCFECGACYIVCDKPGAIRWSYPTGGNGVVFHRS